MPEFSIMKAQVLSLKFARPALDLAFGILLKFNKQNLSCVKILLDILWC